MNLLVTIITIVIISLFSVYNIGISHNKIFIPEKEEINSKVEIDHFNNGLLPLPDKKAIIINPIPHPKNSPSLPKPVPHSKNK